MKSKSEIERRLRKLRMRYAHKYIQRSQERYTKNCKHHIEHKPSPIFPSRTVPIDETIAPRRQITLVVLDNNDKPVDLCMYGAKDNNWPGNTCDDGVAKSCPFFIPHKSTETAKWIFLEMMQDDEWVFENCRDVATLQWVLGERVHDKALSWWEKLCLKVRSLLTRFKKPSPQLPAPVLSSDFWDDQNDPPKTT